MGQDLVVKVDALYERLILGTIRTKLTNPFRHNRFLENYKNIFVQIDEKWAGRLIKEQTKIIKL